MPTSIFFMLLMKNIDANNSKHTETLTQNRKFSGQHVKLLPVPMTQRRSRYLIYSEITTFVATEIFFMLRIKNIDPNNIKYTELLRENIRILGQNVKLLPVQRTQRRSRYFIYSEITTSDANNLAANPLFNIFRNHYFRCQQLSGKAAI